MARHAHSVSLPTTSHPFLLKAEEQLNKLQSFVGSSSLKYEILLEALKSVRHAYESINDLLCMSSNQIGLSHMEHRRWVDQELEESVKLLDICSTSRDKLDAIRSCVGYLELVTRRCDAEAMRIKLRDCSLNIKKANKDIRRQLCKSNESADRETFSVVSVLLEAREITISLLLSIFSYLEKQIVRKNNSMWSLVSRLLEKRAIVCKEENDEDSFDAACLRVNVEELENQVESLFRHIIQCRASLLNTSSL